MCCRFATSNNDTLSIEDRKAEPNSIILRRQGEHVSRTHTLLGILLCVVFSACSTPPKVSTTDERIVHQGDGKVEQLLTEEPLSEGQGAAVLPNSRCTKQLKQGYALRERIDSEYAQSRVAGTFRDRRDEFITRWSKEAGEWATETKAVLLQIGGLTARNRFQNAHQPIGMVSGDLGWNNIRNFLRTRLAALESICKAP
jgi:hypothetical protein